MERGIIKIEDRNIAVTNKNVWMSPGEIADLFYTRRGVVSRAIKTVLKSDALKHYEVKRNVSMPNGNYADLYNLDIIIAIAYHIDTFPAYLLRQWIQGKIFEKKNTFIIQLGRTSGCRC